MVPWLNHENACDQNAVFYSSVENIGKIRKTHFYIYYNMKVFKFKFSDLNHLDLALKVGIWFEPETISQPCVTFNMCQSCPILDLLSMSMRV